MMTMTRSDLEMFLKSTFAKYAAIAVLPLAVLLSQPAVNFAALAFGQRALLETVPIDPRDFLRGDYVTLDYRISRIPDALLPDEDHARRSGARDGHFYVTLDIDDRGVATVSSVSRERPSSGTYLRGRLGEGRSNTVDYGLGVYYVPENTGL
jgi:uncharacterized membrane-anchored protein